MSIGDLGEQKIESVENILAKFNGEPEPENLIEEISWKDGVLQWQKFYDNGKIVKTVIGGDSDSNN